MTQASHIISPCIITVLNLMGLSIHMPGECMGREQSRIGILIRLFENGRISFPVISPTFLRGPGPSCSESFRAAQAVTNQAVICLLIPYQRPYIIETRIPIHWICKAVP